MVAVYVIRNREECRGRRSGGVLVPDVVTRLDRMENGGFGTGELRTSHPYEIAVSSKKAHSGDQE